MATDNQTLTTQPRQQILLTIVVPVRNRPQLIVRTLDSIVRQTCRDFNLIVVDDGSTDSTPEVVAAWMKANDFRLPAMQLIAAQGAGAPAARNLGLEAVSTPYVAFFDSDDVMRPRHVSRLLDAISRNPDAELFRWPVMIIDDEGWSTLKDPHSSSASEMQLHLLHSTLATQRWMARTDLVRRIGAWDESLACFQDYEIGARLLANASPPLVVLRGEPSVAIYPSPDSISRPSFSDRIDSILRAHDLIDAVIASDEVAKATMRYRRAILSAMLAREGNHDQSRRLMSVATADAPATLRLRLSAVRAFHRLLGRGGSSLALFFQRKAKA